MAKCIVNTTIKEVPQPTVFTKVRTYHLELTEEEAQTLRLMMYRTGGSMTGRRGHTDSIGAALDAAGIGHPRDRHPDFKYLPGGAESRCWFSDTITPY